MTNNRTERQVKPFTIGRKNWLFCQSVAGAKASAVLYSLMETCNEHDIPVYPYFATVLTRIPRCHTRAELETLLPYHIDKKQLEAWMAGSQFTERI